MMDTKYSEGDEGALATVDFVEVKLMTVQTRQEKRADLNRTLWRGFGVLLLVDMIFFVSSWIFALLRLNGGFLWDVFFNMMGFTLFFFVLLGVWTAFSSMNRGRDRIQQQLLIREKNKALSKTQLSGAVMIAAEEVGRGGELTLQDDTSGAISPASREDV